MNIFRKTALAAALCLINFTSFAEPVNATATATGSSSALNFTATVTPTSNFVGNNSKLYLAVALGNAILFYSDTVGFVQYAGGTEPPPVRAITRNTETISFAGDASAAVGADIYIGYGTSFAEMASNARYAKKYTIATGLAPIPVFKTSYENAKGYGLGRIKFSPITGPWAPPAWGAADFSQRGVVDIFLAIGKYDTNLPYSQVNGVAQYQSDFMFYQRDAATGSLTLKLKYKGCLNPRKAVVADFNNDGLPDVFVACHGYDAAPWPGEPNKLLLNDGKGGFAMTDVGAAGFYHGAAAADVNGDGYPDIVVANIFDSAKVYFLINNKNGTFTKDTTRLPSITANYFGVELVDANKDGVVDLLMGGDESATGVDASPTQVLYGAGNGTFGATKTVIPPVAGQGNALDFTVVQNAAGQNVIYVSRTSDPTSGQGFYKTQVLQTFNLVTNISSVVQNQIGTWVAWWLPTTQNGQNGVTPFSDSIPAYFY